MKLTNEFLIGCNYWASNAGVYTWKKFDKEVIVKDLQLLKEYGVNCIRVFPMWEDFQPIERYYLPNTPFFEKMPFQMRVNDKPIATQKYESGLSEEQIENFKFLLDETKANGFKVIVSFITGWMSGRLFVPPALKGKDVIGDAEAILWACKFIEELIPEIKNYENIIAWEPGNECNCLHFGKTEEECELWMRSIVNSIRISDNTRPIYSGMHTTKLQGSWNLLMQGRYTDVLTSHPYPAFTEFCGKEDLHQMRAALHAACETSYYRSVSGKPAFVEEINAIGPTYLSDKFAPEYYESSLMTSLSVGSFGYLWWCGFEQNELDFAPYDTQTIEQNMGLAYADRTPKPVLEKMKETSKTLKEIGVLPTPKADAVAILMHGNEPWKSVYGSFLLGVQSGRFIDFTYEEKKLVDSDYYILPCITQSSAVHNFTVNALKEKVKNGAKLLITYNGGGMACFEELSGLSVWGRECEKTKKEFSLNGKDCSIDAPVKWTLIADTANVLMRDQNGGILLSENTYGKGKVVFFNAPLENFYTESHKPENTAFHEIYRLFFKEKELEFSVASDKCMITRHELENGNLGVMINNFEDKNELVFTLGNGYKIDKILYAEVDGNTIKMQRKYAYLELKK